jgi:hypothetical protein
MGRLRYGPGVMDYIHQNYQEAPPTSGRPSRLQHYVLKRLAPFKT